MRKLVFFLINFPFPASLKAVLLGSVIFSICLWAASATAAVVTYDNLTNFQAAAPGAVLEDFESQSLGATSFTNFSVSSTALTGHRVTDVVSPVGRGPTSGSQYLDSPFSEGIGSVTFSFSSPMAAFGVDIVDALDTGTAGSSLNFLTSTGAMGTIAISPLANANVIFFGITDFMAPFNSVTITSTFGNDGISFDDVRTQVVPLPAALPLFGTGLGIMGFFGWRRRRKALAV